MNEAVLIAVCLSDWGAASSHMAFRLVGFQECAACAANPGSPVLCSSCLHNRYRAGRRLSPFYARRLPVFGDVWHLVGGLRYLCMVLLVAGVYGFHWKWWLATAVVNWAGWQLLKRIHRKDWGHGVWERWLKRWEGE